MVKNNQNEVKKKKNMSMITSRTITEITGIVGAEIAKASQI